MNASCVLGASLWFPCPLPAISLGRGFLYLDRSSLHQPKPNKEMVMVVTLTKKQANELVKSLGQVMPRKTKIPVLGHVLFGTSNDGRLQATARPRAKSPRLSNIDPVGPPFLVAKRPQRPLFDLVASPIRTKRRTPWPKRT
jgi:hypothetical protein